MTARRLTPSTAQAEDTVTEKHLSRGLKNRNDAKVLPRWDFSDIPSAPRPDWLKVRYPANVMTDALRSKIHHQRLTTVCEEAGCPNIGECFAHGTATFMVLGDICTRRCSFCDVAHGAPRMPDPGEPLRLASTVMSMQLAYVVITSVDRDDLEDSGARHITACIEAIKSHPDAPKVEVLVPDFRTRHAQAIDRLAACPPDVFAHNIETVEALHPTIRPGADYAHSLRLLTDFKVRFPHIPTKSGLMLGLGETDEQVEEVLKDLRHADCDLITIGQYLRPSRYHAPVRRYIRPDAFEEWKELALALGFSDCAAGPLVRSSYRADQQAARAKILQ